MTTPDQIKKQAARFLAWRAQQMPDVYAVMTTEPETSLLRKKDRSGKARHNKSLIPTEEWLQRKAIAQDTSRIREAPPKRSRATTFQFKGGW